MRFEEAPQAVAWLVGVILIRDPVFEWEGGGGGLGSGGFVFFVFGFGFVFSALFGSVLTIKLGSHPAVSQQ